MADTLEEGPAASANDPGLYNEDLAPTPPHSRTWTAYNYAALWIGMAHCIPTYMMASGMMQQGMNWKQALFTILLGNLIVLIPMLLNSYGGTKYGIPFPVICRSCFGVLGANLPALLRAMVACGWFGIQTWIGGDALNSLLRSQISGWDHPFLCFFAFWFLNMCIIWRGMEAVRWFEGWAAPLVLCVALVLLVYMVQLAHGFGPILAQPGTLENTTDFLRKFPLLLTAQIGFWATLSLNMPDFTRFSKSQQSQMIGQALGLPTTMTFFAAIGVLITSATVVVYKAPIWDPTALLSKPEFANPIVVMISLISIGVATLSVNVAANVVSPAFDFANMWPSQIGFRAGGTITGILGIMTFPWVLMKSADYYINTWLVGYSALLGPIAGIMICDYWVLRRRHLFVEDLYQRHARYTYDSGVNRWAVYALFLGLLPNFPGFLLQVARHSIPVEKVIEQMEPGWREFAQLSNSIYSFAWIVGFAVAFFAYWALMTSFASKDYMPDREAALES